MGLERSLSTNPRHCLVCKLVEGGHGQFQMFLLRILDLVVADAVEALDGGQRPEVGGRRGRRGGVPKSAVGGQKSEVACSGADERYRPGRCIGKFLQDFAGERAQVFQPIGCGAQQHQGNGEIRQILLLGNFAIDGDQNVELVLGEGEQISVLNPSPSAALNGRDRMWG